MNIVVKMSIIVILGCSAASVIARGGHGGNGYHGFHHPTPSQAQTNNNTQTNTQNNNQNQTVTLTTPPAVVSGGGGYIGAQIPASLDVAAGYVSPKLPDHPPEVINPYEDWVAGSPLPPYEVKCGDKNGTILRAPRGAAMAIFKCPDGSKITMFN